MTEDYNESAEKIKKVTKSRKSGARYPKFDLKSSIELVTRIEKECAGKGTVEIIANLLDLSPKTSGFLSKLAALAYFGLTTKEGKLIVRTDLAKQIIYKTDGEKHLENLKQAFFNDQTFKDIYNRFKGMQIPDDEVLRNILISEYNVSSSESSADNAAKSFIDSAKYARLIAEKNGKLFCLDFKEIPQRDYENSDQNPETETEVEEIQSNDSIKTELSETNEVSGKESEDKNTVQSGIEQTDHKKQEILHIPINSLANKEFSNEALSFSIIMNFSLDLNIPIQDLKDRIELVKDFTDRLIKPKN